MTARLGYRVTEEGRGLVVWNGVTATGVAVRFMTIPGVSSVAAFAFGPMAGSHLVHVERHKASLEDTFTGEVEVLRIPAEAA